MKANILMYKGRLTDQFIVILIEVGFENDLESKNWLNFLRTNTKREKTEFKQNWYLSAAVIFITSLRVLTAP
jgi:ribosomal protein S19E (S16A)